MKSKFTIDEQIEHMKKKGVKFELFIEDQAKQFLQYNTYYFKFKSYAKSFERKKDGTFVNLDFAYLVELSKLDAHLRYFIIHLSLDIEHMLKTKLICDVTNNRDCDGYHITESFLKRYPFINQSIKRKMNDSASADLIYKYDNQWPIWELIEVLSFGEFIKLYSMYYEIYEDEASKEIISLLIPLKFLRNAAAHNNCLLNSLRIPYEHTHLKDIKTINKTRVLTEKVSKIKSIGKASRKKKLTNPIIHDFVASLFLFDQICTSIPIKRDTYTRLDKLFRARMIQHKEYFSKDLIFTSTYDFMIKIIDFLESGMYNTVSEQKQ